MTSSRRQQRYEWTTVATLFAGYAGYYVCRSNLSVAGPLLLDDLGGQGFTKAEFGMVVSAGTTAYALGKVFNGIFVDRVGGRGVFLLGMFASVAMTIAFGLASSFAAFAVIWSLNRWVQSMGWVALVKVSASWFPAHRLATVMGILSGSYLIGDAIARGYLGLTIRSGAGWRDVFFLAAGTLFVIACTAVFTLRPTPKSVGLPEPDAPEQNVYGRTDANARLSLQDLLRPLLRSPMFWLLCGVNFGLTLLRETFNTWTPIYLNEVGELNAGSAAVGSLLFPAVGGVASMVVGRLADRPGQSPARIMAPLLVALIGSLAALAWLPLQGQAWLALLMIAVTAFFLIGPYTFVSGVMAIEIGGKAGSATVAGLVDGAGYLGGIAAGWGIGAIAQNYGWSTAFGCLAAVASVAAVLAILLRRRHTAAAHTPS